MGFIEETGAAQHYRDARIAPIYEGTNGIQAADLVGRKLGMAGGDLIRGLIDDIAHGAGEEFPELAQLADACRAVTDWMANGLLARKRSWEAGDRKSTRLNSSH